MTTLVAVLALAAGSADWSLLTVVECDGRPSADVELRAALELELVEPPHAALQVRVCPGGVFALAVGDEAEAWQNLSTTLPRLRRRAVALIARDLVRAHRQATLPTPVLEKPVPSPDLGRDPEAALLRTPFPRRPTAVVAEAAPGPPAFLRWEVEGGARLFLGIVPTVAGGVQARLLVDQRWLLLAEAWASAARTADADVALGLETLGAGVRLFEVPAGAWLFSGDASGTLGVVHSHSVSVRDAANRRDQVDYTLGAEGRLGLRLALGPRLGLALGLRFGFQRGVSLEVNGVPVLAASGVFVALQSGLTF